MMFKKKLINIKEKAHKAPRGSLRPTTRTSNYSYNTKMLFFQMRVRQNRKRCKRDTKRCMKNTVRVNYDLFQRDMERRREIKAEQTEKNLGDDYREGKKNIGYRERRGKENKIKCLSLTKKKKQNCGRRLQKMRVTVMTIACV